MLNQKGSTRTDTVIKLVLVFFLSLLSFSVGTFVGKQFSDSQHRMASADGISEPERTTASAKDVDAAESRQSISEDEINQLTDEFVKKEKTQAKGDKKGRDNRGVNSLTGSLVGEEKSGDMKKDMAKKVASIRDEISNISRRIASGEKVIDTPEKTQNRIPSSIPKDVAASSIGKYTVQISSFPSEDQAASRASELKDQGVSAFFVPAEVNGKTWYRVSAGLFNDRHSAVEFASKLQQKKIGIESTVVQKIIK